MTDAARALVALEEQLRSLGRVVVALSGGVDSSVVAVAARRALGDRARAVTGVSRSLSSSELEEIRAFARAHALAHEEVETDEALRPEYVANSPDRCFYCKDSLYRALSAVAKAAGDAVVVDGVHADDHEGHRPGLRAATDHAVRSPLADLSLGKEDVRAIARHLGLSNAERAAEPCLASRVAYGLPVDDTRLAAVERAERALKDMGFARVRVRHHDAIARIEVPLAVLGDAVARADAIVKAVKDAGFTYVTLDLGGLRSGSLLEVLPTSAPTLSPRTREPLVGRAADPSAPDVNAAMWPKRKS
mgnify:CR=1 FL=1